MSKPERRYSVTRKELLAIVHFVKYFRHYLYGRPFLLRTDHGSLRWLFNFKEPGGQVARWIETLSSYDFEIQHRPGKQHGNADALSRKPSVEEASEVTTDKCHIAAIQAQTIDDQEHVQRAGQTVAIDVGRFVLRVAIEDVLDKAQDPDALAKKIATARRQMMQMEVEAEQEGGMEEME